MHISACDFAYFCLIVAYGMKASAGILGRRYSIPVFAGFGWVPCHITDHRESNFKEGLGAPKYSACYYKTSVTGACLN